MVLPLDQKLILGPLVVWDHFGFFRSAVSRRQYRLARRHAPRPKKKLSARRAVRSGFGVRTWEIHVELNPAQRDPPRMAPIGNVSQI